MSVTRDPSTHDGQKVNSEGQASVIAEVQTEARHVAQKGNVFLVASGFITHINTALTFTDLFWMKNTSTTKDIHIGYLRTCNEVAGRWQMYEGVTALDNTPTTIEADNMKLGSATPLDATLEAADSTAAAFTGGTVIAQWIQGVGHSIQPFEGSLILGPNQSIGLSFAPAATASTNEACITMQVWQVTD